MLVMVSDVWIAQILVGSLTAFGIGITFLPFGATPASIQACQLNTNKRLVKFGGVAIALTTSISAILYLEVLKLNGLIGNP